MRKIPDITPEQENARLEPLAEWPGGVKAVILKFDPVEPVPLGTTLAMLVRVVGYDPDCDGSLMARLVQIDSNGRETGAEFDHSGLDPDTYVILETPDELHKMIGDG